MKIKYKACPTAFGGSLLKNSHAKYRRPVSSKLSMHVVLRAKAYRLKHYDMRVEKIIAQQAHKQAVRIYNMVNVGNHIHLVVRPANRSALANFLRAICGLIARKTLVGWMQRPFSRIVRWGRAFAVLKNYMKINHYESQGYTKKQARFMLLIEKGYVDLEAG